MSVRLYAAKIHWLKHHDAEIAVPVLIDSLDRTKHQTYDYTSLQADALQLLGQIGPEAAAAIPVLESLQKDPDIAIAKLATETLNKVHPHVSP